MKKLIFILLIMASNGYAADKWTTTDTNFQVAFTVMTAIDWAQTRYISDNPDYFETNPILGERPSLLEVDAYFAATTLLHYYIAKKLPTKYYIGGFKINPRRVWQCVCISIEYGYVEHNINLGVGFKLDF